MKRVDISIEVHDLTVSYNSKPALWDIDFELPKEQLIGIIGPNGAGKSTLLKSIMGLLPRASGYVKIFDQSLNDVRGKISYVPQRGSVDWDFPASVLDVVLMGRYKKSNLFNRISKADKAAARICLEKVGIQAFEKRQISQLSGGQQQRVFLARALAQDAELYLMDEPFAGVDAATEQAIFDLLNEMRANGKTILIVHHDLQTAKRYFDWTILLNTRLVAVGPIEQVFTREVLQETYGGKLGILSDVEHLLDQEDLPMREG